MSFPGTPYGGVLVPTTVPVPPPTAALFWGGDASGAAGGRPAEAIPGWLGGRTVPALLPGGSVGNEGEGELVLPGVGGLLFQGIPR